MKKVAVFFSTAYIMLCAFTYNNNNEELKPGIFGIVDPADGAKKVWAISGRDSMSAIPMPTGQFTLDVKAGNWSIMVEAMPPYKNARVDNIVVVEEQPTDAGTIRLVKE